MRTRMNPCLLPASTSVWGSELKYTSFLISITCLKNCLPLCEVVSWNTLSVSQYTKSSRLPLCEVVSWNMSTTFTAISLITSTSVWGSELKCYILRCLVQLNRSTSVWGSELKYFHSVARKYALNRLPLCEVVSWNTYLSSFSCDLFRLPLCEVVSWNALRIVVLLSCTCLPLCEVVSWNVQDQLSAASGDLSTSVWGSELKWYSGASWDHVLWSTSVWGSELKWKHFLASLSRFCLPLYEVVSWNTPTMHQSIAANPSTSVWGSELKWFRILFHSSDLKSTSVWGSELKWDRNILKEMSQSSTSVWGSELKCVCLVLRNVVKRSTSVWGSELKCCDLNSCDIDVGVYLCVR